MPNRSRNVDFWEMPTHSQSVPSPETPRAVILLESGGSTPPEDLLRSLQNRGVRYEVARSVYAAMGALCDDPAQEPPALIILEPQRIEGLDRLRSSLARFTPAAPVWKYELNAQPRLQAMPEPKPVVTSDEPAPEIVVRPQPRRAAPALRLAGDFDSLGNLQPRAAQSEADSGGDESSSSLLSEEELGMLLTDWSNDPPKRHKPQRGPRGEEP